MTATAPDPGSTTRSPAVRWGLIKGLAVPVLTGTLLAVTARPVFWQEGVYLEEADAPRDRPAEEPSVTFRSAPAADSPAGAPAPIRIGRPAEELPPFTAPAAGDAPTAVADTAAERPTLRLSRGFQQAAAPDGADATAAPPTSSEAPAASARPAPAAAAPTPARRPSLIDLLRPPADLPVAMAEPPSTNATVPDLAGVPPRRDAMPAPPETAPLPRPSRPRPDQSPPETAVRPTPPPAEAEPPLPTAPPETEPTPTAPSTADTPPPTVPAPRLPEAAPPAAEPSPRESLPPSEASPSVPPPAEAAPPETAPPQTATIPDRVDVQNFVVTGSTVFDPDELSAIALTALLDSENETDELRCDIDQPVTLDAPLSLTPSQLVQASNAIEQCYIERGYINSGAFIAESELFDTEDNTIEISVVEGRLENIAVEVVRSGLFGLNPSYVEARLNAYVGDPFNLDELVQAVQLLESDPLITQISTEIVPGTETGTSVLNARVVQDDGLDAVLFIDNNRSPSVGSLRRGLSVSQANLLGIGDRLSLGYNFTEGSSEFNIGYTIPVNPRNGVVGVSFTSSENEVIEEPFSILDILSSSRNYEVFYRQPLILTPTEEFAISLTASHRESRAEFLEGIAGESIPFPGVGADADGRTRITALRFGQEWISRNPDQVIALLSEFSLGIDALGATIQPIPPDGEFFLWRGQGQWVRRLGPDTLFILRGNMQLANGPLLPNEQFSFGGQSAGRGYRLNTLLRDNGWFASAEFRLPVARIPEDNILVQVAPFFDVGGGWNKGDVTDTLFLTSTGLGLIFEVDDTISARLDWGIPLSDFETEGSDLQDSGIYFSIRVTP